MNERDVLLKVPYSRPTFDSGKSIWQHFWTEEGAFGPKHQ